jgi:hypothetical protein
MWTSDKHMALPAREEQALGRRIVRASPASTVLKHKQSSYPHIRSNPATTTWTIRVRPGVGCELVEHRGMQSCANTYSWPPRPSGTLAPFIDPP